MKKWIGVVFLILVVISLVIHICLSESTTYQEIFTSIGDVINLFSPIGVFLLGFFGLLQWKEEFTFKKRNKIAEEIALSLLGLRNAMHEIRVGWPIAYTSDAKFVKEMTDDEAFYTAPVSHISFVFSENTNEKLASKLDSANSEKEELEQKLKIAAILWNNSEIEKAGSELFSFYYNIINAIYRIRFRQSFEKWSFEGEEIEKDPDLFLVLHFDFRTKYKTADELNSAFKNELDSCSNNILEKISQYLY